MGIVNDYITKVVTKLNEYKYNASKPWLQYYDRMPEHLDYYNGSLYDMVNDAALRYPQNIALEFFNTKITYSDFIARVDRVAVALKKLDIVENECVTICMPNIPEAIDLIYAVNKVGAICNVLHPLLSADEIAKAMAATNSTMLFVTDVSYGTVKDIEVDHLIVCEVSASMNLFLKTAYNLKNKKNLRYRDNVLTWKKFFKLNCSLVDEKVPPRDLKSLYSTPTGQVLEMPGENSAQQLIVKEMKKIEKQRLSKKADALTIKKRVRQLLNIPSVIKVPEYRMLRHARDTKGIPLRRMGLETEKGILVTLYSKGEVLPLKEKVELIISEKGSYNVLGSSIPKDPEAEVRSLDYRGCGDSLSYAGFHANYDQDYFYSSLGVMWNEPLIGRRVLAAIKFLKAQGVKTITLRSEGLGIIPAVFAAVLSDVPVKLYLEDQKIPTYTGHVLDPAAPIPQSFVPGGILKVTDLDELIRLFPDRFIR